MLNTGKSLHVMGTRGDIFNAAESIVTIPDPVLVSVMRLKMLIRQTLKPMDIHHHQRLSQGMRMDFHPWLGQLG